MSNEPVPGAPIPVPGVTNLRDLGGWKAGTGGAVRRGSVYRSTELSRAEPAAAAELRLGTIVDLRGETERRSQPDAPLAPVVVADVLADSPAAGVDLPALLADPRRLAAAIASYGGLDPRELMVATYRSFLDLPSAKAAYRTLFETLAEADAPVLFHCTNGKDRTGWAAAVLLLLLGVDEGDVMADYLLTNEQLLPTFAPLIDGFAAHGGDPELLTVALGVHPDYLESALETMRDRHGHVESYVIDGLRVPEAAVRRIQERLVV